VGPRVPSADDVVRQTALIHREFYQLSALILIAVAAFFLTRAVAASNRNMSLRDAAEWYNQGQQAINAGRVDDAIDAFRRATVRNRDDNRYALALAEALAHRGDDDEARSLLTTLRETAPDDAEINLQLARIAGARHDITEALRFYHNALYAPWPTERAEARRQVRLELIRFLVIHDQRSRALSELLALSTDLPDDVSLHLETARLFEQAGDSAHALNHFQRALQLASGNATALAGAGRVAFELGDFTLAQTYLRRAPPQLDDVARTLEVVDVVLSSDPLANRVGSAERRRRLVDNFAYAQHRLSACVEEPSSLPTSDALALLSEARMFEPQLQHPELEQDVIEMGTDLVDRIERLVIQRCGAPTTHDRALVLIGRRHGAQR
jgi:tetratricopeptide (TPR) repeat protein